VFEILTPIVFLDFFYQKGYEAAMKLRTGTRVTSDQSQQQQQITIKDSIESQQNQENLSQNQDQIILNTDINPITIPIQETTSEVQTSQVETETEEVTDQESVDISHSLTLQSQQQQQGNGNLMQQQQSFNLQNYPAIFPFDASLAMIQSNQGDTQSNSDQSFVTTPTTIEDSNIAISSFQTADESIQPQNPNQGLASVRITSIVKQVTDDETESPTSNATETEADTTEPTTEPTTKTTTETTTEPTTEPTTETTTETTTELTTEPTTEIEETTTEILSTTTACNEQETIIDYQSQPSFYNYVRPNYSIQWQTLDEKTRYFNALFFNLRRIIALLREAFPPNEPRYLIPNWPLERNNRLRRVLWDLKTPQWLLPY